MNVKLLNPKNLAREVYVYGYHFSWKIHTITIICSLLGVSAIGVLFQLKPFFFCMTIVIVGLMLPVLILHMYKGMYEQKRFSDAVTYGEQMLYSFQKSQKIITALKETRELFEEGRMRNLLDEAIAYLESGNVSIEGDMLRDALAIIEQKYSCEKIRTIHELLVNSEYHGGKVRESIFLLLDDIEVWKRRNYLLQAEKKKGNRDNIVSIIVATILCAIALYALDGMGRLYPAAGKIEIFSIGIIQISSFVFIMFMLYVLLQSMKGLARDWLKQEGVNIADYSMASYERVMNYDERNGRRKQMIVAIICLVCALVFLIRKNIWISIGGIGCTVVILIWNRISYNLARKDVTQELYVSLPQWLMEMALLLQNNNVQISLMKSVDTATPILKRELELLQIRLMEHPNQLHSYTDFCKRFDVPEVQSCMKMLHSISEAGTGDAAVQMQHLITRVHEMQNRADDITSKRLAFHTKILFSYPVLAATLKLLIDLTIGMLAMFKILNGIGGV